MICNTAVFYDIENLICLFTVKNNTILHLDEIYRRILEVEGVQGVSVQKAYADWAVQINRNLRNYVLQIGIEPVQIFNTNQNDKVKNAADVSLIIDAVELLAKRPDIENYVIVSGDGIFAFLAKKLHEHGKRVIGCGFTRNTNNIFRNACDYFISLEKADKTLTATSNKSALAAPSSAAAPAVSAPIPAPAEETHDEPAETTTEKMDTPAPQSAPLLPVVSAPAPVAPKAKPANKIPRKFPKNKFSEALSHGNIEIWKDTADANGALLVVRDIVNTMFGNGVEETADLEISVFKTYVDYYVQGFKMSQYNFKRFGEFVRFVLSNSPYCIYTAEGTTLKIARRGTVGTKGSVNPDMRGLQVTLPDGQKLNSIFDVPNHMPFTYTIVDLVKPSAKRDAKAQARQAEKAARKSVPVLESLPESPPVLEEPIAADDQTAPESTWIETEDATPQAPAAATMDEEAVKPADVPAETDAEETANTAESDGDDGSGEGSIRKWIKANFMRLALENALSTAEVRRLVTTEYSQKTFGVKTPVFKEVLTRSNLREQRIVNGKVKYWKETFKYNGKTYLIYKEWIVTLHRDRFVAWLKRVEPNTDKE